MDDTGKNSSNRIDPSFPYADILHCERPEIRGRKRMTLSDRAAQFAPFAALTGYGEAIDDTAERTAEMIRRSEEGEPFGDLP